MSTSPMYKKIEFHCISGKTLSVVLVTAPTYLGAWRQWAVPTLGM